MLNSFVAIDFETANRSRASACEVGLVRVVDGTVAASYQTLIKPHAEVAHFEPMNVAVHGIHSMDVADAPAFDEVWPQMVEFIGGAPLVAHNAAFDMRVLRDALELYGLTPEPFDYFCTLALARRTLTLMSYALAFVALELGIENTRKHRVEGDTRCAAEVATSMLQRSGHPSLYVLTEALAMRPGRFDGHVFAGPSTPAASSAHLSRAKIEELRSELSAEGAGDGPLSGKRVAFTGGLVSMTRAEAATRVLASGGEPQGGVTRATDYLVVGMDNGYAIDPRTALTAKFEKAQKLRDKGAQIEVLDELTFCELLD